MNEDRDFKHHYLSERSASQPTNSQPTSQQVPEFEAMWARAVTESRASTAQKPRLFAQPALPAFMALAAIVLAMTSAMFFGGVFSPTTPDNDDALASFALDLESEQALAFLEWESPTDFLLSPDDDWFYTP